MASSNKFTVYLSSYSVFLSSIAGVMVSDYYLVRKGYYDLEALYSAEKDGPYYGKWGVSWRGYTAYICGIMINVVGFAGAVGADVPVGAEYIYNINYFSGFIVAGAMYWALSTAFPVPAASDVWNEVKYQGGSIHLTVGKEIETVPKLEEKKEDV